MSNRYSYCSAGPVNSADSTGHMSKSEEELIGGGILRMCIRCKGIGGMFEMGQAGISDKDEGGKDLRKSV